MTNNILLDTQWVKDSIIPITFFAATGGHFVRAYCSLANLKLKAQIGLLSEHGNAHSVLRSNFELFDNLWIPEDDPVSVLPKIKNSSIYKGKANPYFILGHCAHDCIYRFFTKSITILPDNPSIILQCLLKKVYIDKLQQDPPDFSDKPGAWEKFYRFSDKLHAAPDSSLKIPFTDLISSDKLLLVTSRLSEYTGIPYENFDLEFYRAWQRATNGCLI
jgi:hypothetical protein